MSSLLVTSAAWDLGIQWSLFLVATLFGTDKFYDFAGNLSINYHQQTYADGAPRLERWGAIDRRASWAWRQLKLNAAVLGQYLLNIKCYVSIEV